MRLGDIYEGSTGLLELRAMSNGSVRIREYVELGDRKSIREFCDRHAEHDIYFGVATRDGKGGKKANIVSIPALWVDIDFKTTPREVAEKKLAEFPLRPTIVVSSGGGMHPYWKLREPAGADEIQQVEAVLKGLATALGGDMAATDATRILRLPNTRNHKYPDKPMVKILGDWSTGAEYNLADFDDYIDRWETEESTPQPPVTGNIEKIMQCRFMAHCEDQAAILPEPEWYAMITQLAKERGGPARIHDLSRLYPKYRKSETDQKIIQALNNTGPMTCMKIKSIWDCGMDCGVKSPAALAYKVAKDVASEMFDANVASEMFVAPRREDVISMLHSGEPGKDRNMALEAKEWLSAWDLQNFSIEDLTQDLSLSSEKEKSNIRVILSRLVRDGVIRRTSRGLYAKVVQKEAIDWYDAPTKELDISLPLDLGRLVKIYPKNIIVIAGEQNAGKTALLMDIARTNMKKMRTHYFSSEMGAQEFRSRVDRYTDVSREDWRDNLKVWSLSSDFEKDLDPGGLNIIDFLELSDNFYQIAGIFRRMYDILEGGVAVIAIQKTKGAEAGRGGSMSLEKPRLYVTLSIEEQTVDVPRHTIAKIVKAKSVRDPSRNPNGLSFRFRIPDGAHIAPISSEWFWRSTK
jgi:hypothetical protein